MFICVFIGLTQGSQTQMPTGARNIGSVAEAVWGEAKRNGREGGQRNGGPVLWGYSAPADRRQGGKRDQSRRVFGFFKRTHNSGLLFELS